MKNAAMQISFAIRATPFASADTVSNITCTCFTIFSLIGAFHFTIVAIPYSRNKLSAQGRAKTQIIRRFMDGHWKENKELIRIRNKWGVLSIRAWGDVPQCEHAKNERPEYMSTHQASTCRTRWKQQLSKRNTAKYRYGNMASSGTAFWLLQLQKQKTKYRSNTNGIPSQSNTRKAQAESRQNISRMPL